MAIAFALAAVCLVSPVSGPVTDGYSPVGRYGGHWGIDLAADVGSEVRASASGRVTFAGSVAGMRSVTIEPVLGLKVSVSYLSEILVSQGDQVARGQLIGRSGTPHGVAGVHVSVRINGRYVDPASQLGCRDTDITRALRLVTPPQPYSRRREHRHSRRDVRSDSHRPPPRSRDRLIGLRARSGGLHAGRRSLAKSGPRRL